MEDPSIYLLFFPIDINGQTVIYISGNNIMCTSFEIDLMWVPENLLNDKLTLIIDTSNDLVSCQHTGVTYRGILFLSRDDSK